MAAVVRPSPRMSLARCKNHPGISPQNSFRPVFCRRAPALLNASSSPPAASQAYSGPQNRGFTSPDAVSEMRRLVLLIRRGRESPCVALIPIRKGLFPSSEGSQGIRAHTTEYSSKPSRDPWQVLIRTFGAVQPSALTGGRVGVGTHPANEMVFLARES